MPNNNSNRTIPSPFDIIPEPVCILDGAGTILDVFDCSVPVFINNRQGRPGARIYDILLPEITAALRKSVDEALRSGRRVLLDNSVEAGTLRLTIHPLKSPSEIVDRMLLIAEEMIDNDRTKSLLEKERIFNKTIMESIPGTFYMLDENWHYVKWECLRCHARNERN